jgi:hypothetical protein
LWVLPDSLSATFCSLGGTCSPSRLGMDPVLSPSLRGQ